MPRMLDIEDVLLTACLGQKDLLQQKKMMYLFYAKKVWQDLNFNSIKLAAREVFSINKKTNSIKLPCNSLYVSSVSYIDKCGIPHPCFINASVGAKIVDISQSCGCGCDNKLCNTIKGYEAVTEVINAEMPDGSFQDFTCVTRKDVDSNGWYYEQKQYPQRVYEDGVWTDTVLHSENIQKCKLQIDANGCVEECEDNYEAVVSCGCYSDYSDKICKTAEVGDTWISYCNSNTDMFYVETGSCCGLLSRGFSNIYNITESGDRLVFPANFGWDRVLVRYYYDVDLNELKIPAIAEETFINGLKTWEAMFDDTKQNLYPIYQRRYESQKLWLISQLNRYNLFENATILAPKRLMPSYIRDNFTDNNYNR